VKRWVILFLTIMLLVPGASGDTHALQAPAPKFILPFANPPGPNTWLFQQHFGNTIEANTYGKFWYAAGQGLHFGTDFEARCGTPILAIADGVVTWVDAGYYGAGPHNLVIAHRALGYVSVYGHLLERPALSPGQDVKQGQVIAKVGDPDVTCKSRPHLHLEIRSLDSNTAYNPETLINADWDRLGMLSDPTEISFAKDLSVPDRWQTVAAQPTVKLGYAVLNAYRDTWPPTQRVIGAAQTLPAFEAPALPVADGRAWLMKRLTAAGCCTRPWWSADSQIVRYVGPQMTALGVNITDGSGAQSEPLAVVSPDGKIAYQGYATPPVFVSGSKQWTAPLRGAWPSFSPEGRQILWQVRYGEEFPNEPIPQTEIWLANADGSSARLIKIQAGGSALWLDERLLLLYAPTEPRHNQHTLSIYTIATGAVEKLGTFDGVRLLSVAPGGGAVMFLLPFQSDPSQSGVYLLKTLPGAAPEKLPFIGAWRWRDSQSVVVVPFNAPGDSQALSLYDIRTKAMQSLASPPFRIANSDWSISPDGQWLAFVEASDQTIRVLRLATMPTPPQDVVF